MAVFDDRKPYRQIIDELIRNTVLGAGGVSCVAGGSVMMNDE